MSRKQEHEKISKRLDELVSEVASLQSRLKRNNTAFLSLVGHSLDAILVVNQKGLVMYANYMAVKLLNKPLVELLGEPLDMFTKDFSKALQAGTAKKIKELVLAAKDTEAKVLEPSVLQAEWNGELSFVISLRDITGRKRTEDTLAYMEEHDLITKLPNRLAFENQMAESIEQAKASGGHMAILYLDLDNFKVINDTFGHDVGDELLKQVSEALTQSIRQADSVARLGGDEFAIILNQLRKTDYAGIAAQNILKRLDQPFNVLGETLYINASIGIAVYPEAGKTSVELMRHADMAMYDAKKHGKNQVRYYSTRLNIAGERALHISSGIRNALGKDQFFMVYQPIVDLNNQKIYSMEALIRWQHPELGVLFPDEFLPVTESLGMMPQVTQWVMRRVFSDIERLGHDAIEFTSINVSADELSNIEIVKQFLSIFEAHSVDMEKVVFELNERSLVKQPERFIQNLKQLFDFELKFAIDDYGRGYSSLGYFKHIPISILKIDKSFIENMMSDSKDQVILRSTIDLAHDLGLKVVAEGVEHKEQVEFLTQNHCDYAQGYYFARPMVFDDLIKFIDSH